MSTEKDRVLPRGPWGFGCQQDHWLPVEANGTGTSLLTQIPIVVDPGVAPGKPSLAPPLPERGPTRSCLTRKGPGSSGPSPCFLCKMTKSLVRTKAMWGEDGVLGLDELSVGVWM